MDRKKASLYLFIFIASVMMFFSSGHYGGDGLENYLTAESIVLDRDLIIHDRPFAVKEMKYEARGTVDSEGSYHSKNGIGMPVLLIPLYIAGNVISMLITNVPHDYLTQFAVSMTNPLLVALTATVLFVFLGNLGYSKRVSFFTTLCYSFCTMAFIYARSGFSEPAVGFFVMLAILFVYKYEKTDLNKYLLYAACCIGYTLLIKKSSFLYLPIAGLYLIYRSFKARTLGSFMKLWFSIGMPIAFFVSVFFYVQNIGMRNSYTASRQVLEGLVRDGTMLGMQIINGLYYYLLSPGKGFFLYNAPLILALFALKDFTKKRGTIALCMIVFIAVNVLYYSLKFVRGTLFSWGPRYFYLLVPVLCVFMAEYIENARSAAKKMCLAFFCLAGLMVQLPNLFINLTNYLNFVKEKLGLQEYLINFIPGLSPVKGTWCIFLSAVRRASGMGSLDFVYSPDTIFSEPMVRSLAGYDKWDVWWINILSVFPAYSPLVIIAALILSAAALMALLKLKKLIFDSD